MIKHERTRWFPKYIDTCFSFDVSRTTVICMYTQLGNFNFFFKNTIKNCDLKLIVYLFYLLLSFYNNFSYIKFNETKYCFWQINIILFVDNPTYKSFKNTTSCYKIAYYYSINKICRFTINNHNRIPMMERSMFFRNSWVVEECIGNLLTIILFIEKRVII